MSTIRFLYQYGCLAFVLFIFTYCSHPNKTEIEYSAYCDIIEELVNVDYGILPAPPPPGNNVDSSSYLKQLEEYHTRMDTVNKIILMKDSMVSLNNSDYEKLFNLLDKRQIDFFRKGIEFKTLQEKAAKSLNVADIKMDDAVILPISIIKRELKIPEGLNSNDLIVGQVILSRIIFDDNNQKGILYYVFICGKSCGFGEFVLIKKKKEKWIIIQRVSDWII